MKVLLAWGSFFVVSSQWREEIDKGNPTKACIETHDHVMNYSRFARDSFKVHEDCLEESVQKGTSQWEKNYINAHAKVVSTTNCNKDSSLKNDLRQTFKGELTDCSQTSKTFDIHIGHTEQDLIENV